MKSLKFPTPIRNLLKSLENSLFVTTDETPHIVTPSETSFATTTTPTGKDFTVVVKYKRYHHNDEWVFQNLLTGEVTRFKQGTEESEQAMAAFMEGKELVYD
jgi:hypothetical protein